MVFPYSIKFYIFRSYTISAEDNKVARVTMEWDKTRLSFMVDAQVDKKINGFKVAF